LEALLPPINALIPLILFVALILAASLYGLAASRHFPRRPEGLGSIVLFGSMTLVIAGLVAGIAAALPFVPWYAAIIGGGLSISRSAAGAAMVCRQLRQWMRRAARVCRGQRGSRCPPGYVRGCRIKCKTIVLLSSQNMLQKNTAHGHFALFVSSAMC
jgi:hypothetical protein